MAGGSLGSLDIQVLANIASMVSDLGKAQAENAKAAREFQKQWKESTDAVAEGFKSLAELAGVALSVGGIIEIGKQALESAEKMQNLSQSIGASTQVLQTAGYAAALVGGDLELAGAAMAKLERSAEQAAAGNMQEVAAFHTLGIESKQLAELLKDPDQLLITVAQDVAELGDGAGKTAAVMQIFGRGAAAIIPFLNELGHNFQELRERAEGLGIVLSNQDQAALVQAQEGFNELGQAVKGAGNLFTIAMLPAINAVEESLNELASSGAVKAYFEGLATDVSQFVVVAGEVKSTIGEWTSVFGSFTSGTKSDFAGFVQAIKDDVVTLANNFANNWELIKAGGAIAWAYLQTEFNKSIAGIEIELASLAADFGNMFRGLGQTELGIQFDALAAGLAKAGASYKIVTADLTEYETAIKSNNLALAASIAENQHWADGVRATAAAAGEFAKVVGDWQAALVKGDIAGNLQKLETAEANIHVRAEEMIKDGADAAKVNADAEHAIAQLTAAVSKADAAQGKYNAHVKETTNDGIAAFAKQEVELARQLSALSTDLEGPYAKAWATYSESFDKVEYFLGTANALYATGKISLEEYNADVAIGRDLEAELAAKYAITTEAIRAQNDVGDKWLTGIRDRIDGLEQYGNIQKATAEVDKLAAEALAKNVDLYGQAADAGQNLTDVIAAQRAGLIAAGASLMDYADQLKASQDLAKSWADTFAGDLESVVTAIEHGQSAMQALDNLWKTVVEQMIQQAIKLEVIGPLVNSAFGLSGSSALPTGNIAQGALGQMFGGQGGGLGNMVPGGVKDWFSGLLGGGGGFNASSGLGVIGSSDELGLVPDYLGGASQGTYGALSTTGGGSLLDSVGGLGGLTSIIGGAVAGYQIGGVTGAAALGVASYFIPVIGWIAGIASLVNSFTGGGLFGTDAKPYGTEMNIDVGQGGANASAFIDEKGKKSLYRGSYWKTVSTPVDQQTQDALQAYFQGLSAAAEAEAKDSGQATADIITGTFHETFDKAGKMLTQESTILGQKFKEDITAFQSREFADTLLANMGAASNEAQAIAVQWQSTAATLLAGAQFLAQAQHDITHGNALVEGDTLTQLTAFVQGMQAQGETLIQTYARLSTEAAATASTMQTLGLHTDLTGEALIKFDDDMVKAAGGVQNLSALWGDYYNNFFSDSERAANKLKGDQAVEKNLFGAIGEDPTESMATFREHFTAIFSSLSADDVVKWLAAAESMIAVNKDLGTTATATASDYQAFVDQFKTSANSMTEFETAVVGLAPGLQANIDKANELAIAAGMSGASIGDLTNILQKSVSEGAAAFGKLRAEEASLAASLFGTGIDQLKSQITAYSSAGGVGIAFALELQKQLDAAEKQQAAAKQFGDASQLLRDFAQDAVISGQSLDELAAENSVPLAQFAEYLGTNVEGLRKQFDQAEKQALAAMGTEANTKLSAEILADMYALWQGKAQPFDVNAIASASAGTNPAIDSGKPGRGGTAPTPVHAPEVVAAVDAGTSQSSSDMSENNARLDRIIALLEQIAGGAGTGSIPPGQRRTFLGTVRVP